MTIETHTRIRYAIRGGHVHTIWSSALSRHTQHGLNGSLVFTLAEFLTLRGHLEFKAAFEFIDDDEEKTP